LFFFAQGILQIAIDEMAQTGSTWY